MLDIDVLLVCVIVKFTYILNARADGTRNSISVHVANSL